MILRNLCRLGISLGGLVLLGGLLFSYNQYVYKSQVAPVKPGPVPLCTQSLEQWITWRDHQIGDLLTPTLAEEGQQYLEVGEVASKALTIYQAITTCEQQTPHLFKSDSSLGQQLLNLKRFTQAASIVTNNDHQFGFSITDQAYLDQSRPYIEVPELLRSQEFLQKISDPTRYYQAYQMIEEENKQRPFQEQWVVLPYKSHFLTSPDNTTYGRFFIHIPGDPILWLQFAIATPDMMPNPPTIHSMSLVAVKPTGQPVNKYQFFWVDYWRIYSDTIQLPTRYEAGQGTANCYYCHKTAVIPVYPLEEYTFDQSGTMVVKTEGAGDIPRYLNNLIENYGPPYFADWLDPAAYGPPLGPFEQERTDAFLEKCTQPWKVSHDSFDDIRASMNCSKCHDSTLLGPINYPQAVEIDLDVNVLTETNQSMPLAQVYIEQGWMPPDNNLTPPQRQALANCLMTEYYDFDSKTGLLVDWLKNTHEEN